MHVHVYMVTKSGSSKKILVLPHGLHGHMGKKGWGRPQFPGVGRVTGIRGVFYNGLMCMNY